MSIDAHQEKLSFQAEVKQLLHIVVHSLYSNKEIFLRELISNASDAIDKLRFEALADPALYESDSNLSIRVCFDTQARTLTISDNGIGMSREEIIENLGTIAKSGTREFLSKLTGDQKKDAHLIGQFGVGFYSAFIVANDVTVISRRAGLTPEHGVRWESKGDGEYTIANVEKKTHGTDVILHMKEADEDFLNDWRLRNVIKKYSDHINIPIMMPKMVEKEGKEEPSSEWETVNQAKALWTLPKNQITDEQYKEFYKYISHDFEDPLLWTLNKVEGDLDYTALLYVPAHAPMNLWQRDQTRGLRLYVQRVFIMDNVEQLLPLYLRFIRGVVDTQALPLNISREILQDHPTIAKLRAALVKRILDLLEKTVKDSPEKYATFWAQFGTVLKEGPAEDFSNRERIAKLVRFSTTQSDSEKQTVSFEDYVQRMKSSQKKIYYITADTYQAAKSSPHLEIFRKNNVEVILFYDRIDEWFVAHLAEFSGKPLQSVAKGEVSLEEITGPEDKKEEKQQQEIEAKQKQTLEPLLNKMKEVLGDQIKEVRLSHRLTSSPVCLVREANSLGPQMERLLKAAGQAVPEDKPILEINPDHKLITKLNTETNQEHIQNWIHILYDQALLSEGSQLLDPASYVQRVNELWLDMLE